MKENNSEKKLSLEDMFSQIEEIIEKMENPKVPLEESFTLYQQGTKSLKACNGMLDEVEKKMQIINADGELEEI